MDTPRKATRKINRPPSGPHPRLPSGSSGSGATAGRPATERLNRPQPAAPAPANNKSTMMVAGGVGGVALLLLVFYMVSGTPGEGVPKSAAKRPAASAAPKPKPVDVSRLVLDGEKKCEEGLQIIRECQSQLEDYRRSGGDSSALRARLQRGIDLIGEGAGYLNEANEKSNGEQGFLDKKYPEAKKLARGMIGELK